MQFSKNFNTRKQLIAILFLLVLLTAVPLLSVQASVGLLFFRAVAGSDFIRLEWETAQELDNLGFNLYRGLSGDFEDAQKLNSSLIPSQSGGATGAFYEWPDSNVESGILYTYWLEDIDINSNSTVHDPVTASTASGGGIPTSPPPGSTSTNTPAPTNTPTRTPEPTTQSGSTAAPQTPTRTPTTQSNSTNPTATSAPPQVQSTSISNNPAPTSASQSVATTSPEEEIEEVTQIAVEESGPAPEAVANASGPAGEATPRALDQSPSDEETEAAEISAQQIGQGGQDAQETGNAETTDPDSPNRSTVVLMALIGSVILLLAGAGGIIALVLNRNKQTSI
jgi:hypothetical protein